MDNLDISEVEYGNWGKCVKLTNGIVEVIATLDFGPRIIRYSFVNGENIFFEDVDDSINKNGNKKFNVFGDKGVWHIYGGHRLWFSPEAMPASYYPDNEKVEYKTIKNGVRLIPPPQAYTNLQFQLDVILKKKGKVEITHKITNVGAFNKEFAPWALTVMSKGGVEYLPQPKKDTGLLGNRILALWPYTNMSDERVVWGLDYISLRQNPNAETAFKLGINSEHGFATYFNHNDMFVKYFCPIENGSYPDGGVSYETYTNNHMLEMESIGELKTVAPGETVTHVEKWELFSDVNEPNDEKEFTEIVSKYIKI